MTRLQLLVLKITSAALVVVLLGHFTFTRWNTARRGAITRDQVLINNARQVEPVLDQLARRIAKGSDTEPRLKNILVRHRLNVTLDVDGKKKSYP